MPLNIPTSPGKRLGGDPADEREHFEPCEECGQSFDKRDLSQVFHHATTGHKPLPTN